jgi:hypothetical protein
MLMRQHLTHAPAWAYRQRSKTQASQPCLCAPNAKLHVRSVPFAQRKAHPELRIECRKLVQALELIVAAGAGANIQSNAQLMT